MKTSLRLLVLTLFGFAGDAALADGMAMRGSGDLGIVVERVARAVPELDCHRQAGARSQLAEHFLDA